MLCRVLLAAIALSYLICVLFLSGIQKDDLEVSLLKKLERYNVDLNAYDDKKLRQDCPNATSKLREEIKAPNKQTETIKYQKNGATTESNAKFTNGDDEGLQYDKEQLSGLDEFCERNKQYFKSTEQSKDLTITESIFELMNQNKNDISTKKYNLRKSLFNKKGSFNEVLEKHISEILSTMSYGSGELVATTDSLLINKLFNKNYVIEKQLATNIAAINTLTENIVTLKNQINKSKSISQPKTKQRITKDVIAEFNSTEIINNTYNKDQFESIPDTYGMILNSSLNRNHENKNEQKEIETAVRKNTEKYITKPLSPDVINQIADSIKQIVLNDLKNEITAITTKTTAITSTLLTTAQTSTMSTTPSTFSSSTGSATPTAATTTGISLVLLLLLFFILGMILTKLKIVGGASTLRSIDINKVQAATQVLEKFMELFEKFKTSPEKILKQTENYRQKLVLKPELQMPIMLSSTVSTVSTYGVRVDVAKTLSRLNQVPFMHDYMPPQMMNAPMPKRTLNTKNSVSYMPTMSQTRRINPNSYPTGAIMIQTNSEEINPLLVRIKKPTLLNFNIVLTTETPWTKEDRERWNLMMKYRRYPVEIKNIKESMSEYSNDKIVDTNGYQFHINSKDDLSIRLNMLRASHNYSHNDKEPFKYTKKHQQVDSRENDPTVYGNKYIKTENQLINHKHRNMNQKFKEPRTYLGTPSYTDVNQMLLKSDYESLTNSRPIAGTINRKLSDNKAQYIKNIHFRDNIHEENKILKSVPNLHSTPDNQFHNLLQLPTTYRNKSNNILPRVTIHANEFFWNPNNDYVNPPRSKYFIHKINTLGKINSKFQNVEKQLDDLSQIYINSSVKYRNNDPNNEYAKYVFENENKDNGFTNQMENIREKYTNYDKHSLSEEREFSNRGKTRSNPGIDLRFMNANGFRTRKQRGDANLRYRNEERTFDRSDLGKIGFKAATKDGDKVRARIDSDIGEEIHNFRNRDYRAGEDQLDMIMKRRPQAEPLVSEARYYKAKKDYFDSDVRGYHEKLEGGDIGPDSVNNCGSNEHCLLRVISRQQMPLAGVKPARHDDTHFNRFLKTQQKVNQMLERILATKTDVVSIESLR